MRRIIVRRISLSTFSTRFLPENIRELEYGVV